jgi:type I restriction enzyme, S subunit
MKQVFLGDVCEINPRMDPGISDDAECSFVPMEHVDDISGTIAKTGIRLVGDVKKGYTFFKNDDVVFAKITPCMENGKCAIGRNLKNGIAFGSTEFHVVRAKEKVVPEWVYYYLRQEHVRQSATHWFRGTAGQQRVPSTFLEELKIPLPPLDEQKRIASLLARADRLRGLRRAARALGESLLQGVFLEMFGHVRVNDKKWELARFEDVCESRLGKMLDDKKQTGKHKRQYLRNFNVQWFRFDLSDIAEMDFDEKDRKEFRLEYGDILMCEGGEVGRCAIWRKEIEECYFQKALHRIRPNLELVKSEYLVHLFWWLAQTGGLGDFTSQVTIAHLTGEKLKELVIPVPPLSLQDEFARVVARVEGLRGRMSESERQVEGLFGSLLHEAFNG